MESSKSPRPSYSTVCRLPCLFTHLLNEALQLAKAKFLGNYTERRSFVIGRPLSATPFQDDSKNNYHNRYARLEQIRQDFWKHWQREYISVLHQRTKWKTNAKKLNIGDHKGAIRRQYATTQLAPLTCRHTFSWIR